MKIRTLGEVIGNAGNNRNSPRKDWPEYTDPEGAGPGAAVGQKQEALLEPDEGLAQHSIGKQLGISP